jgi:hypothetical protein
MNQVCLKVLGVSSIFSPKLEMGIEVNLEYPMPDSIADTYLDEECSELHWLNANHDLGEFEVDIDMRYDRGRIAVRQNVPHPQYEYA